MANFFFEIFYQLDDASHLNRAKKLAALGKMAKARRNLFEVLTSREERFGEKSPESIEVLLWVAEIHLLQATVNLDLAQIMINQDVVRKRETTSLYSQLAFLNTYRSISAAMTKELRNSHSVLRYAERELAGATSKGTLEIRLQIALLQVEDCLNWNPKYTNGRRDFGSSEKIRQERISKALAEAESIVAHMPGYRELNCIDDLVNFVRLHFSQSSNQEFLIRASQLKAKVEEERAQLIEYEAEITLHGRLA